MLVCPTSQIGNTGLMAAFGGLMATRRPQVTVDAHGRVIEVMDATGKKTSFKYDSFGTMIEFCDRRGTLTSKDGILWYRDGNQAPAQCDWIGTIEVDPQSGRIKETSYRTDRTVTWNLDGSRLIENADRSCILRNPKQRITEIIDQSGLRTTFRLLNGRMMEVHGHHCTKPNARIRALFAQQTPIKVSEGTDKIWKKA